jgi:hypothetical protein
MNPQGATPRGFKVRAGSTQQKDSIMPRAGSKASRCTRADILANIDDLAQEIIDDVRAIAEHQKHIVEHGEDWHHRYQISERLGNAAPTLQMLCYRVRYRGAVE